MSKVYLFVFSIIITCTAVGQCSSNWLLLNGPKSGVQIGDLDIPGNTVSVEARFNRTTMNTTGIEDYQGDLVSKHRDPNDVNYLLRPDWAGVTTDQGFFETPNICDIDTGKTYYVAMVYDGDSLKFYRNGFLMSAIPASGNLIQNNWITAIGTTADLQDTNPTDFLGYINEVRIWNVARTQAQLRQFMNVPLPNPTTQTGLLAYYEFNSLTNLQGNAAWNGTLTGNAIINQTNPTCASFVADSCGTAMPVSLKNFQGSLSGQNVKLYWTTFNEVNTKSDMVERSYDGRNFTTVSSLPAKGLIQQNNYQFTDAPSFSNKDVYYRIKFEDKNGSYTYSNILVFSLGKAPEGNLTMFPNPAKNYVQLNYTSSQNENSVIRITDVAGKIVLLQNANSVQGNNSVVLNFQKPLIPGSYFVQIFLNGKSIVTHLTVE